MTRWRGIPGKTKREGSRTKRRMEAKPDWQRRPKNASSPQNGQRKRQSFHIQFHGSSSPYLRKLWLAAKKIKGDGKIFFLHLFRNRLVICPNDLDESISL